MAMHFSVRFCKRCWFIRNGTSYKFVLYISKGLFNFYKLHVHKIYSAYIRRHTSLYIESVYVFLVVKVSE
jgi:hypothetical protein